MSSVVQNSVQPNSIVHAADPKLHRNIKVWMKKNSSFIDTIQNEIGESLSVNQNQNLFNKYKENLKKIKKNKTKLKKNIKIFNQKNQSIIRKHENDTELKLDENSPDYVYKEFKRLVKQWKYDDEFKNLVARYPEFNYQMKRRKKLQPGEKRTRRKKYSKEPIIPKVSLQELRKQ